MNKVYKLMWNAVQNAWVVCSELSKKGKSKTSKTVGAMMVLPLVMTVAGGVMNTANAAECTVMANGSVRSTIVGNYNVDGCNISSMQDELSIGEWGTAIRVYAKGRDTTLTISEDIKTDIKQGQFGLSTSNNSSGHAYLDARGKTIDLTLTILEIIK